MGTLLLTKSCVAVEAATHNTVDAEAYTLHRILHGVPEGIEDIVPMQSFPMESNLDLMGAREVFSASSTYSI